MELVCLYAMLGSLSLKISSVPLRYSGGFLFVNPYINFLALLLSPQQVSKQAF